MSLGQQQHGFDTSWGNVLFLAGMGTAVGIVLLMTLAEANECPRLRADYRRMLTSPGGDPDFADWILDQARRRGCRWAQRWPFVVAEKAR